MPEQSKQDTLTDLRIRAGLTRRDVALALDVTEKTIYMWETRATTPKMTVAQVERFDPVHPLFASTPGRFAWKGLKPSATSPQQSRRVGLPSGATA
ncbi:MAG: helix-turn-helix domain-containing protein, partial [Leptolyngbya sp. SIO4C1]|nr:helix-turn-helix domain-containing protein [Leptolyngbya sp. SIO4C1]